jgi:hypothetical protein
MEYELLEIIHKTNRVDGFKVPRGKNLIPAYFDADRLDPVECILNFEEAA